MTSVPGLLLVLAMPAAGQGLTQAPPPDAETGAPGLVFQGAYLAPLEETPYLHPAVVLGDEVDVRPVDERNRARGYYADGDDRFRIAAVDRRDGEVWVRLEYAVRTHFPTPPYAGAPLAEAPSFSIVVTHDAEAEPSDARLAEQLQRALRVAPPPLYDEAGLDWDRLREIVGDDRIERVGPLAEPAPGAAEPEPAAEDDATTPPR